MPKGPQPVDPKLLEREKMETMTIAMGLKMTHNAAICWRDQVEKEGSIRRSWNDTYNPGWEAREAEVIARVAEREAAKKAEAEARPERPLLFDGVSKDGKGRVAYLRERNKLAPQDKQAWPQTAAQAVGWRANKLPEVHADNPWARKTKGTGFKYASE